MLSYIVQKHNQSRLFNNSLLKSYNKISLTLRQLLMFVIYDSTYKYITQFFCFWQSRYLAT